VLSIQNGVFVFWLSNGNRVLHEIGHIMCRPSGKYFKLNVERVNFNFKHPVGFRGMMTCIRNELGPFAIEEVFAYHFSNGKRGIPASTGNTHIGDILSHICSWKPPANVPWEYFTDVDKRALNLEYTQQMIQPLDTMLARWHDTCVWLRVRAQAAIQYEAELQRCSAYWHQSNKRFRSGMAV
jgi:hypothetical protein